MVSRWLSSAFLICSGAAGAAPHDFPAVFDPTNLSGSDGFLLSGVGGTVSDAGDVNNDGIADLVIGFESAREAAGATHVIFGRDVLHAGPFPRVVDARSLDGHNGFVVYGANRYDQSASAVSGAGDVNGDGVDDLVIGARYASANGIFSGAAYVVFGRDTPAAGPFPASIELSALDGRNGFLLNPVTRGGQLGVSVASAGDVNGDGIDDVIAAAPFLQKGASYVIFGRNTTTGPGFPARLELAELNGSNGFVIEGANPADSAGFSVSAGGDLNADGVDDLIVGTTGITSHVVFGRRTAASGDFPAIVDLAALNGVNGFTMRGVDQIDQAGRSVSDAGDVNGDGVDDLIVGAQGVDDHTGAAYAVFGRNTAADGDFPALIELGALTGRDGFVLEGVHAGDRTGVWVDGAGDANGDGVADLLISAWGSGRESGVGYLVFGRFSAVEGEFPAAIDLSRMNAGNGFVIGGPGNFRLADTVSGLGDVNHDGLDDFVLTGAVIATGEPGAYIVFGRSSGPTVRAHIQCPGDLDDDGGDDLVLIRESGLVSAVGLDGVVLNQFALEHATAPFHTRLLPDTNGNGAAELIVLGKASATGNLVAEVRDLLSGGALALVTFGSDLAPVDLEVMPDLNGNGIGELAVLHHPVTVEVRDALTASSISTIRFSADIEPMDLLIHQDRDGNGWPELAVLSDDRRAAWGDKIEIRDMATGARTREVWMHTSRVVQQERIADLDGNGSDEVAVLRVHRDIDGNVSAAIREVETRGWLGVVQFDVSYRPMKMLRLADMNDNGSDEIAVFGLRLGIPGNNQKVKIRDSATGRLVGAGEIFFDRHWPGEDVVTCADVDGNGAEDVAMLGRRPSDAAMKVIVKDAGTGERLAVVRFE